MAAARELGGIYDSAQRPPAGTTRAARGYTTTYTPFVHARGLRPLMWTCPVIFFYLEAM